MVNDLKDKMFVKYGRAFLFASKSLLNIGGTSIISILTFLFTHI